MSETATVCTGVPASPKASILLISNYPSSLAVRRGGRELLCALNADALSQLYGDALHVYALIRKPPSSFLERVRAIRGHIDGATCEAGREIVEIIRADAVRTVFIDGSNLGSLAKHIRQSCPSVEIVTFFHNVEARFFWGALRDSFSLHGVAVLIANYAAERRAVRFSHKRICLSKRDDALLRTIYGEGSTCISPLAVRQPSRATKCATPAVPSTRFALFVGGSFYANIEGIRWFAKHVGPQINMDVCVIGKGMEAYRAELEQYPHMRVVGSVDSLEEWYERCEFVLAPIFDGSGMKTKVAEALMFGKRVIGTAEAFSGYEDLPQDAGLICRSAREFIEAFAAASSIPSQDAAAKLRRVYEQVYSFEAARHRLFEHVGALE